MKNIIDRFKKRLRENRGYLIMESAFVYPIMFFILMFLIYMGNMFYLKAKVDAIVTQEAQTYAEKFADPNLESFSSSIPTSTGGDTEVNWHSTCKWEN
jgi:Flp pilus assembly protein TadG